MSKNQADSYLETLPLNRIYAGGEWRAAFSQKQIEVISPDDGTIVARVCAADNADVDLVVSEAKKAFENGTWADLTIEERAGWVSRLSDALAERADDLALCWTRQIGAPYSRSKLVAPIFARVMDSYLEVARDFAFVELKETNAADTGLLAYEPVGVVAAITPWNVPLSTMLHKIGPALLTGCTVVMKPAPETPLEAYIIAQCAHEIGLPAGVLNLVCATAASSAHLSSHPLIDKVTFTGSVVTGQRIAQSCGSRVARCSLELGGKSAAIILDDVDLPHVAELLMKGICSLSGQNCAALSRVLVSRERQHELVTEMRKVAQSISVGHPFDEATEMGPVATRSQLKRILDYIEIGIEEGATLVTGGSQPDGLEDGCFVLPTIFSDVSRDMRIAREEIFGPVICVTPFDSIEDAISIANDTEYGLAGAIFTNDTDVAYRIARKLRTGTVGHNGLKVDFGIGFGGFKNSGIGREGGIQGLKSYLESKTILLDSVPSQLKH